jgi:signal transduction histidine kinase
VKRPADRDDQLIGRSWRRATWQIAALFATALLLLGGLAALLVMQTGRADARRQVIQAVADRDALTNPPHGTWIYQRSATGLRSSPGAPAQPADPRAMAATARDGRTRDTVIHRYGREYEVRTQSSGGDTLQAVLDITDADRERHRLYWGLAATGAVGLLVAVVVGALIARRATAPLGQAIARQRRFIADASHELRTPLTQLHTRAQLLERGLHAGTDPERLRGDAQRLVQGTRQLGEIVQELLLAAQLRTGPTEAGPVDLGALAAEVVDADAERAAHAGVEMVVSAGDDCRVPGVATALRRVLVALLDNALAHTSTGGHVRVRLSRSADGGTVQCVVEDDGEGFAPEDNELIFERFARGGHGDRRRFGLGLALVREVVESHGGTVRATGRPGAGATFTLVLPAWPENR